MTEAVANERVTLNLRDLIGRGYDGFWYSKCRYRAVKGSRNSKKSYTAAYWIIINMMRYPQANTLVVRKVADTLRDSCYAMLLKVIYNLHVERYWKTSTSPLQLTFIPTGQTILFRGLDDPYKLSSIMVAKGVLCWCWFEEAYQIAKEEDFDKVDQSIRGAMPEGSGLWKSIIVTFNPWNRSHWLRERFFEKEDGSPLNDGSVFAMTTTYECNEWLDEDDYDYFNRLKERNPRLYEVAGLGNWGNPEGLVYENWEEVEFDIEEIKKRPGMQIGFGLDFGYSMDPSALCCFLVDVRTFDIWIFDELYEQHLTNRALAQRIIDKGYGKETIIADSAAPKDIAELGEFGLSNVRASYKFPGSIINGIRRIQDYKIHILPKCVNFLTEIQNYMWMTDRNGVTQNKPSDFLNHLLDAFRYGMEGIDMGGGGFMGETKTDDGRQEDPTDKEKSAEASADVGWCYST